MVLLSRFQVSYRIMALRTVTVLLRTESIFQQDTLVKVLTKASYHSDKLDPDALQKGVYVSRI
jgi:hypothetical protein